MPDEREEGDPDNDDGGVSLPLLWPGAHRLGAPAGRVSILVQPLPRFSHDERAGQVPTPLHPYGNCQVAYFILHYDHYQTLQLTIICYETKESVKEKYLS